MILTLNTVRMNIYLVIVTVVLLIKCSLIFAFVVCKHVIHLFAVQCSLQKKKKGYDNIGCDFNQKTLGPRNTAYIRLSQVQVTCLAKLLSRGAVLLGAVYFKMDIKFIQRSLSILW